MTSPDVVRLTYFEGIVMPMVEVWTSIAANSECVEPVATHTYTRINQPPCASDKEWLAMQSRATHTVFLKAPPNEAAPEAPNVA